MEVLVNSLILKNAQKTLVNFTVEGLVLVSKLQMLLSQAFALDGGLVQLTFTVSDCSLKVLQLAPKFLVLVCGVLKSVTKLLVLALALITLSLQPCNLFLKFVLFLSKLLNLLVRGANRLLSGPELFKKSLVVLLCLHQHVFEFGVGRLQLPGFLLELLQSAQTLVKQLIKPFTLILVLCSLFLELLKLNKHTNTLIARLLFSSAWSSLLFSSSRLALTRLAISTSLF